MFELDKLSLTAFRCGAAYRLDHHCFTLLSATMEPCYLLLFEERRFMLGARTDMSRSLT